MINKTNYSRSEMFIYSNSERKFHRHPKNTEKTRFLKVWTEFFSQKKSEGM